MKFVVAGYGSRGDVEPCIAVGRELLRRGHDVRLAVTVPPDMVAFIESVGLTAVPYGRDWQAQLRDEDFVRMIQNPLSAIHEAIEYVAQVAAEKTATLMSLTNGGLGTRCLRAPAMAVATGVPAGHGHVYVADVANGWAAVLQPPGWTPEKTAKLRPLLHASDT